MWVCRVHCVYCVSGPSQRMHSEIKKCACRLKDKITALQTLWLISLWDSVYLLCTSAPECVCARVYEAQTHVLVSLASFCMMSRIMRQAEEQPSGVEWMVMGFSAAPAFSFRWMSTLREGQTERWTQHREGQRRETKVKSTCIAY